MKFTKLLVLTIILASSPHFSTSQVLKKTITAVGKTMSWVEKFWDYLKTGNERASDIAPEMKDTVRSHVRRREVDTTPTFPETCEFPRRHTDALFKKVSRALVHLSRELDLIETRVTKDHNSFRDMLKLLAIDMKTNVRLMAFDNIMNSITQEFEAFATRIEVNQQGFNATEFCEDAQKIVNTAPLHSKVATLYDTLDPNRSRTDTLLQLILSSTKIRPKHLCGGRSVYEHLHSLYASIIYTEIKAYAVEAFSIHLLHKYKAISTKCNFSKKDSDVEVKVLQDGLKARLISYTEIFMAAMEPASMDYRACDAVHLDPDDRFIELVGAFQTVIELLDFPHVSFPSQYQKDLCYFFGINGGNTVCIEKTWCIMPTRKPCRGSITACVAVKQPRVCVASSGPRRYQWLKSDISYPNVTASACNGDKGTLKSDVCLCMCNDNGVDSDGTHTFNLQPVESDIAENKIITGMKFVVVNRVIQFQIQQGTLNPHWKVSNVTWKKVNDISEEIRYVRRGKKLRGEFPNITEGRDFLLVSDRANYRINLDRLIVPHEYVLTGVKFALNNLRRYFPSRIEIQLIATKFDYEKGQLYTNESIPVTPTILHFFVTNYETHNVDRSVSPLIKTSTPNQYLQFSSTDWHSADAGQTTIPFWDASAVETKPPSPIGGVELFYKTKGNFVGAISLACISLDYVKYMRDSMQELDLKTILEQ